MEADFHRKHRNEAIQNGCLVKWKLAIQTILEKKEHDFEFDILDATKIWPEELVPLEVIGEIFWTVWLTSSSRRLSKLPFVPDMLKLILRGLIHVGG